MPLSQKERIRIGAILTRLWDDQRTCIESSLETFSKWDREDVVRLSASVASFVAQCNGTELKDIRQDLDAQEVAALSVTIPYAGPGNPSCQYCLQGSPCPKHRRTD